MALRVDNGPAHVVLLVQVDAGEQARDAERRFLVAPQQAQQAADCVHCDGHRSARYCRAPVQGSGAQAETRRAQGNDNPRFGLEEPTRPPLSTEQSPCRPFSDAMTSAAANCGCIASRCAGPRARPERCGRNGAQTRRRNTTLNDPSQRDGAIKTYGRVGSSEVRLAAVLGRGSRHRWPADLWRANLAVRPTSPSAPTRE